MPDDRRAYNIPTVALRFFNVYGPRQALSNPYTGVLAIFASRLLNDKRAARSSRTASSSATSSACTTSRAPAGSRSRRRRGRRGVQHRQRPRVSRVREIAERDGRASLGKTAPRAGDHAASTASATSATASPTSRTRAQVLGYEPQVDARGRARRTRRVARRPGRRRPRRRRPAPSSQREGWRYESRRRRRRCAGRTAPTLITGGAGFIGTNLAHRLLEQGRPRDRVRQPVARRRRAQPRVAARDASASACDVVDRRRARRRRRAPTRSTRVRHVFHFAAQVAVTTSLVDPRARLRRQRCAAR